MLIKLPSSVDSLPLLDTELVYVNTKELCITADDPGNILINSPISVQNSIGFSLAVGMNTSHSRFNPETNLHTIKRNSLINIIPDLGITSTLDYDSITHGRAIELLIKSEKYEVVYLFWSGGIDSTVVLCSILQSWNETAKKKLKIVMSSSCIDENANMYHTYIKDKLSTVDTGEFLQSNIKINNTAMYITGDSGDPIMGHDNIADFDSCYPGIFNEPWRAHADKIISYFATINFDDRLNKQRIATSSFDTVCKSINCNKVPVESIFDFMWWINFDWGYSVDLYSFLVWYQLLGDDVNIQQLLEENICIFFNTIEYQQWAVSTIGTNLRIQDDIRSFKWASKKFIFDFNQDADYFKNKKKEASLTKNKLSHYQNKLLAIDTDYTIYYRPPQRWQIG